jgi:hypothetical protein
MRKRGAYEALSILYSCEQRARETYRATQGPALDCRYTREISARRNFFKAALLEACLAFQRAFAGSSWRTEHQWADSSGLILDRQVFRDSFVYGQPA